MNLLENIKNLIKDLMLTPFTKDKEGSFKGKTKTQKKDTPCVWENTITSVSCVLNLKKRCFLPEKSYFLSIQPSMGFELRMKTGK